MAPEYIITFSVELHTFQVEEDIGLVVLEHLCHELDVHVLDIDIL
jgi:hypothetical protein